MISLCDILSNNKQWLLDQMDSYASKVDFLRNTGFNKKKQEIVISEISQYICEVYNNKIDTTIVEPDDEKNSYRFACKFLKVYYNLNLGINRNNILRLVKHAKNVYIDLIQSLKLHQNAEKEFCIYLIGFFDNFETSIFDSWYSLNNIKETDNFTFDEFRDISLMVSETAALGILVVKGRKIFYINQYIEKLLGYDIYELQTLDFMDLIDEASYGFFKNRAKLCDNEEIYPEKYTLKIRNKFGIEKYVDVNEKDIVTNGKKLIIFTIADVTAYVQVQDELTKNSESLRTLITSMTDFVCFKDEKGRWLEANDTAIELYDLHKINYKGMKNNELASTNNGFYKDVFEVCEKTDENAWETGHATTYEEIINKPDGRRFIYEITKVPLYYEDGRRKSIVELGRDVTSRKEAEIKLKESEERYRTLFNMSPDAIYIKEGAKIIFANDTGIKLFGADKIEDVQGKNGEDFLDVHPDYKPDVEKYMDVLSKNGIVQYWEEKFVRKSDGKVLEREATCSIVPYAGHDAIMVISRDISEKKKTEKLILEMSEKDRQLLEAIEYDKIRNEFFTNISHELRTPLNVILGTLQLLEFMSKQENIDYSGEKFTKYTMIMKQNCYRLVKIVNNLIDITKIDSGYFPIHIKNRNIIEIVENIAMSIIDYAENKGISIQFDTDTEEKVIACDPDKIERIMLNLLSNAIKFTRNGGEVKVRMFMKDQKVMISVKDTGIGIPENKLPLIFDRFVQVDRSLSRMNEGSGIGLSLAKSLVEMHGGEINANSSLGEGSEFVVALPDRLADESCNETLEYCSDQSNEYNINVEFSDIYF